MQNLGDAIQASSMNTWALEGPFRLVKVVGLAAEAYMRGQGKISGYFTQEKYLYGLTPAQIEQVLGLRPNELSPMARVYAFARLPKSDEVEFKLTAAFAGGKPFDDGQFDQIMQARADFRAGVDTHKRSWSETVQAYPPGSGMVPQWTFKAGQGVPVGNLIATITPQLPFPRPNGSIKPYTPHNRGPIR